MTWTPVESTEPEPEPVNIETVLDAVLGPVGDLHDQMLFSPAGSSS